MSYKWDKIRKLSYWDFDINEGVGREITGEISDKKALKYMLPGTKYEDICSILIRVTEEIYKLQRPGSPGAVAFRLEFEKSLKKMMKITYKEIVRLENNAE